MADTAAPDTRRIAPATIVLAVAALVALAAIIYAMARSGGESSSGANSAAAAAEQPKSVEEAIRELEARLQQNPDDADDWRRLGWAYFEIASSSNPSEEDFRTSIARSASAYRRAAELEPNNAENWSALGEVLQSSVTNVSPQAEEAFRRALAIDPRDARARYFVAVQKDLRGDHRTAINEWLALLRDTPAGAPWEGDLRRTIEQTAEKNRIDIAGRLAPPRPSASSPAAMPGPTPDQLEAARNIPPSQQDQMARGMVERLAERLRQNPRDEGRWIMMMRSRMHLNEPQLAAEALRTALATFASDPAAQQRLRAAATEYRVPQG